MTNMKELRPPLPPRKHDRETDLVLMYLGSAIALFLIGYSIWTEILGR